MDLSSKWLHEKLSLIGPGLLKPEWRMKWTKERPTTGYCYLVSEILYHYVFPDTYPYVLRINDGTHWFLRSESKIIDLTCDQFDFSVPYQNAHRACFFKGSIETTRGFISKRAFLLSQRLGI